MWGLGAVGITDCIYNLWFQGVWTGKGDSDGCKGGGHSAATGRMAGMRGVACGADQHCGWAAESPNGLVAAARGGGGGERDREREQKKKI